MICWKYVTYSTTTLILYLTSFAATCILLQVFTAVFTLECVFKLLALGPAKYFREPWNAFDFAVVSFSLIELYQELEGSGGGGGLSVLRSFRLVGGSLICLQTQRIDYF